MPYVDIGGVTLAYTDQGTGPTLVLHHGSCCDSHDWDAFIASLPPRYRLIAYDARGHGRSGPATEYSLTAFARDLAGLIEYLDIGSAYVVGHSMGGAIATIAAVEYPEHVRGVVAMDPGYGHVPEFAGVFDELRPRLLDLQDASAAFIELGAYAFTPETSDLLRTRVARLAELARPGLLGATFVAQADDPTGIWYAETAEPYLRRRSFPVLAMHTTPGKAEWDRSMFQDPVSEAYEFPTNGHWLHIERPADVAAIVDRWIAKLETPNLTDP